MPKLVASGDGHVVNIGSIAGLEPYPGGAGYNAAKHAVRAVTQVLRMELLGQPVRVTEIDPGMAETEFSVVRFDGDEARAAKVYEGVTPLTADDVADCVDVGGHPAEPRQHRPDRRQAPGPGDGNAGPPPRPRSRQLSPSRFPVAVAFHCSTDGQARQER